MARAFQPALAPDERMLLCEQGGYTSGRSWRLGVLCLTDRRLLFAQGDRQRVDIPLPSVAEMGMERRRFVLATKPCLALRQRDGGEGSGRKAWLTVAHIEKWWTVIAGLVEEQGTVLHAEDTRPRAIVLGSQPLGALHPRRPESRRAGAAAAKARER